MSNQPPYNNLPPPSFIPSGNPGGPFTPTPRGRPRGANTGSKRGRKPRGALPSGASVESSPRPSAQDSLPSTSQMTTTHWSQPNTTTNGAQGPTTSHLLTSGSNSAAPPLLGGQPVQFGMGQSLSHSQSQSIGASGTDLQAQAHAVLSLPGIVLPVAAAGAGPSLGPPRPGVDEDGEGEDEILPAMADDDYSAQLSWQSQSKDNLKVLMDNFSPAQYDRFEAYRRHALPKQAVRKLIQQTLGQQVSQPVAQIVAGFAKVFVGEIVEKARSVQERRGDVGPLSPDHLREAYRMYQDETGRVGAARPLHSKRLFVR